MTRFEQDMKKTEGINTLWRRCKALGETESLGGVRIRLQENQSYEFSVNGHVLFYAYPDGGISDYFKAWWLMEAIIERFEKEYLKP